MEIPQKESLHEDDFGRKGRPARQNSEFNRIDPLTMAGAAWVVLPVATAVL